VPGPELERQLNSKGYTLGHFPQSFEFSTLGGWIATRSSGQQSYHYGRIEDLFAGGCAETPSGKLEMPPLPASAAGPDLRQFLLGSEGRMGIITQATVRIRPMPEFEAFYGVFFLDWERGVEAVRQIAQECVGLSVLRLSNARETETTLALSGKEALVRWANRGLGILGYSEGRCLLVFGVTGNADSARQARRLALSITRSHGGLHTGETIGKLWRKSRFLTPYLRNVLWDRGYAVDTLETAIPWRQVIPAATAIQEALHSSLEQSGERAWVFAHLSHVYTDGASIYITYLSAAPPTRMRR
jgi:alkyldihydroxyacetonephosphate synthase